MLLTAILLSVFHVWICNCRIYSYLQYLVNQHSLKMGSGSDSQCFTARVCRG